MDEAKSKTQRIIAEQPTCTYCGGKNNSTSRDHCPPITIFDDRWRPAGMEFGACDACHEGTREMDAVIGFISRFLGTEPGSNSKKEMQNSIRPMFTRYPHLLEHFNVNAKQIMYHGAIGNLVKIGTESALKGVMNAFAARMGLALYRLTNGYPAPPNARIICRWHTNVDLDNNGPLNAVLESIGLPQTLVQGTKHVAAQFRFWPVTDANEPKLFGCVAVFRESFGITAFVDTRDGNPAFEATFQPGFLQGYKV